METVALGQNMVRGLTRQSVLEMSVQDESRRKGVVLVSLQESCGLPGVGSARNKPSGHHIGLVMITPQCKGPTRDQIRFV